MPLPYNPADDVRDDESFDLDEYVCPDWLKLFAKRHGPFTDVFDLKVDKRFFVYRHQKGYCWGLGVVHDDGDETVVGYAFRCSEMLLLISQFVPGFEASLDQEMRSQLDAMRAPLAILKSTRGAIANAG